MGHHHPFQFLADISLNNGRGPFAAFAARCHRSLPCSRTGSLFQALSLHRCHDAASAGPKSNFSLPDLGETDQAVRILPFWRPHTCISVLTIGVMNLIAFTKNTTGRPESS